ncbi:MAG: GNAT family N-acetyltransferase [Oscillospiraceae bacterium]
MIRDFILQDKPELLDLVEDFYNSNAVVEPIPVQNFANCFDEIINKNPFVRGLTILHEGEILGYAQLSFTYSSEADGMVVLFEELYIKPSYRGKGIAHQVFDFVEKEYRGKAKRIRLECCHCNEKAHRLYSNLGFNELDYVQMIKD